MPIGYERVTVTYEEVRAHATRREPCPVCGRRIRRSRTFVQTVSPFNLVADRSRPKTYAEVQAAVDAAAKAWAPDTEVFLHGACREA